jgi:hypothetical protein
VRSVGWVLLVLALPTSGCGLRLSDPIYAVREIEAEEPSFPDRSLIFGSIEVDAWLSGDLDSVVFLKRGPQHEGPAWTATRTKLFRVFRPRTVKDNHFLFQVPPGAYELDQLVTSGWGRPQVWVRSRDGASGPMVFVTRPGIYDIGSLRIERVPRTFRFLISRVDRPDPQRQALLERALEGTSWAQLSRKSPR